jgi:radical SAM superfamily enzyme YgiQ (UPF0313 family)
MKCLLIIPSWIPEDIFPADTAGSQINYWQPLGTLYVASSLIKAGHDVRFLDGSFMSHAEIIDEAASFNPAFIGIYSTTFGWKRAVRTACDLKRTVQDVFITAGGPFPIAMQEECLKDSDCFDAVVTGEGEITVVQMLHRLSQGGTLEGVEGVVYRNGNEIVRNRRRPLIEDIDSLPFPARELLGNAWDYIPPPAMYKRKPVAVIMTARGCSRRCIFCFLPQ